jgi:hypothetical protein
MMVSSLEMVSWLSRDWTPLRMVGSSDSKPVLSGCGDGIGDWSGFGGGQGQRGDGEGEEEGETHCEI